MLNKMKLFEPAEIYLNGNNLFTWHSLPGGMDPEARTLEVYPLVRRYNLGIRVSF